MDIAQAKRRENIAEYILYLWQLEDLLRALKFSPEAMNQANSPHISRASTSAPYIHSIIYSICDGVMIPR